MVLFEVAKVIGWIILFIGLILQPYAEYSPQQHISPPKADMLSRNTKLDACIILASVLSTFLSTLDLFFLTATPWFLNGNRSKPNLYTGPEFWSLITATHVLVALQLL